MVAFCPSCRLSMAFSRQVFPVSGSARQSGGQSRARQPGPLLGIWLCGATFELAVHEVLLALLQEQQQALQLLTVILSNSFEDLPAVIELQALLRPGSDRVLGRPPGGQKTPSANRSDLPSELIREHDESSEQTKRGKNIIQNPSLYCMVTNII